MMVETDFVPRTLATLQRAAQQAAAAEDQNPRH
jgi:hypothetical protein